MLAQRERMRGIGSRIAHSGLARAWNAWVGLGDENAKLRGIMQRGCGLCRSA